MFSVIFVLTEIKYHHLSPGNDQLKKKVLEAGQGRDSRPQKGQNVKIHLKTYLKDGKLVEEQSDLAFTLGDGDVIQVKMVSLDKLHFPL